MGMDELKKLLDNEAQLFDEQAEVDEERDFVRPRPPVSPSQVYSIRLPVDKLETIRAIAAKCGTKPTAMIRQWVLDRIDMEEGRRAMVRAEGNPLGIIDVKIEIGEDDARLAPEHLASLVADEMEYRLREGTLG